MPDIFGPDITEAQAREMLSKALGCKPVDVQISHSWLVTAPKATGNKHQFSGGGTLRESAGVRGFS